MSYRASQLRAHLRLPHSSGLDFPRAPGGTVPHLDRRGGEYRDNAVLPSFDHIEGFDVFASRR
eukprot:5115360-Alexandrium_andersonii.AAC.1